ncbi:hypothetical protein [Flavobacterium sp. SM2513]|uniref:hypothetical protein n=1 Tax=Flavobacterium sp. SM2513 TaxID=3424766 RepID=UPI003D7F643F
MATRYLERKDEKLTLQLDNFASKLPLYATVFGFLPSEVDGMTEDATHFSWMVHSYRKIETHKKEWTRYKTIQKKGEAHVATNQTPLAPVLNEMPTTVAPGVEFRFRTMVNRIKAHQNYTKSIGQNLGIEKSASEPLNIDAAQPVLKAVIRGGKVNLLWKKGRYSGILLEKDSGNGFVLLDRDFTPPFVDNSPFPASGESAIWMYRASYFMKDEKVGVWSDIVTITVAG